MKTQASFPEKNKQRKLEGGSGTWSVLEWRWKDYEGNANLG